MATVTLDELVSKRAELESQIKAFKAEHIDGSTARMTKELKDEWNRLNTEFDDVDANIAEREAVDARIKALAGENGKNERGAAFSTPKSTAKDIYDLSNVERSFIDPSVEGRELKERAKRVLEGAYIPPRAVGDAKAHVQQLAERLDGDDGRFSRYMVATMAPAYKRAYPKLLTPNGLATLSREEQAAVVQVKAAQRALSLTTDAGGFAIPFELDPSIIPTSNLAVNPFRTIARVEQIVTDEWNGVTSAGVTASWDAEAAEVSDDSPTLAQPSIPTFKGAAFVPFSIEVGMDWAALQSEMGMLIQDAKDELEATAFATGNGTTAPQGVITGATTTVSATTGGAFNLADVYALETALGPRFRPRADFVMNRAIAQKIRQFDTAGGAQLWQDNLRVGLANQVPTPGSYGDGARVLGYGAYEASAMSSSITTGQKVLVLGDFSRYYLIADRVGLGLEYIPHMFHTSNNRPSGQRGIYAFWRTGAEVLAPGAFRVLQL